LRIGIYEHEAPKSLIRVTVKLVGQRDRGYKVVGEFFIYSEDAVWALEQDLKGLRVEPSLVASVVEKVFSDLGFEAVDPLWRTSS